MAEDSRPSLRALALDARKSTGYKSYLNRLLEVLDDDDAGELREVLSDLTLSNSAVAKAIQRVYGHHPAIDGRTITENMVLTWRHGNVG